MVQKASSTVILFILLFFSFFETEGRETLRLMIKEDRSNCTGVGMQTCMQVKYKDSKNWELFYDNIKGFAYKEGYRYTLLVYRSKRKNVPADASSYTYSLKSVLKKQKMGIAEKKNQPATGSNKGDIWNFVSGKTWKLIQINGVNRRSAKAMIRFDKDKGRMSGNGGCNGFFGGFTATANTIAFQEIASTMMACADPEVSQLEFDFMQQLRSQTFTFDVADQTLQLYRNDSLVLLFALDASTATDKAAAAHSGLRGTIYWKEGNHMPGPGSKPAPSRSVSREIVFYALTGPKDVTPDVTSGFYKGIRTKQIKSIWSDQNGKYHIALPPGTYSVFIKENGLFYANRGDGAGMINPVTIVSGEMQDFDIWIDYKATY